MPIESLRRNFSKHEKSRKIKTKDVVSLVSAVVRPVVAINSHQ